MRLVVAAMPAGRCGRFCGSRGHWRARRSVLATFRFSLLLIIFHEPCGAVKMISAT